MNRIAFLCFAIALCAAWLPDSAASGNHRKQNRNVGSGQEQIAYGPEEKWEHDPIAFTTHDRNTITSYYRGTTLCVPGPTNTRLLRLNRNSILSAESQNRLESLSGNLERRLQPLYSGYVRGIIGCDVVILEVRTHRIMDIIHDVTGRH